MGNMFKNERFQEMVKATGASLDTISKASGINLWSLRNYISGKNEPDLKNIVKIADYFGVPVDYLIGRTDIPTELGYKDIWGKITTEQYEKYLCLKRSGFKTEEIKGYEAPWPYNFLELVSEDVECLYPLTDDKIAGLNKAIDSLTVREQLCVRAYFEEGLTYDAIAKRYYVTRERIRQVVTNAVRKFRHPIRANYVKYGLKGLETKMRENDLINKTEELDAFEAKLNEREKQLIEKAEKLQVSEADILYETNKLNIPIIELPLSVRTYNCLTRANIKTVADIIEYSKFGLKLHTIRNLGRKSLEEIRNIVLDKTGIDVMEYELDEEK